MKMRTLFSTPRRLLLTASALALMAAAPALVAVAADTPAADTAADASKEEPTSVRLSPSQFRQTITDVFGSSIVINGRFEPEVRDQGLLAIGARRGSITDMGLERYDDLARNIAMQVVDPRNRATLIPCTPASATAADDACARQFISRVGKLLYRRSLADEEINALVRVAGESANVKKDFYAGISTSVANMLVSANFLFRYQFTEADPANKGAVRMDAHSKATALSYFLWNSAPDEMLIKAAEDGSLHTQQGLAFQVDRMLSSPRMEGGVRAFFSDMLGFSDFETLSKDPMFFPRFTVRTKDEAQEQTLRTIVDHVIKHKGDYRDLFTTRQTYLTRSLAALYGVPLIETTDNGQPMRWIAHQYPENDPRSGILSQISFVALHSPAGRTSPTHRGKALREAILCQTVPPPPGNVDFSVVEGISEDMKTARERLAAHAGQPMCAGCHKITDPMGLALENFDSAGGYRLTENGAPIDTNVEINGVKVSGAQGLAQKIHDDPAATSCVARRVFAFGTGRLPGARDPAWQAIEKKFAATNYNVLELMREVALSELFQRPPAVQFAAAGN
jgi:hypothetical protein